MFLSRASLPSEEYHIIILVEELCEMGVKANMALHVDVTGPGKRLGWLIVSVMTHVSDSCYISLLTLVEYTHPWVNRGKWWLVRRGSAPCSHAAWDHTQLAAFPAESMSLR